MTPFSPTPRRPCALRLASLLAALALPAAHAAPRVSTTPGGAAPAPPPPALSSPAVAAPHAMALNSHAAGAFGSGSTGADGAFAPTANTVLQIPPSGVFNFTTVNIPSGVTVSFTKNATNTPVTILAAGDVVIDGTINVSGGNGTSTFAGPTTGAAPLRTAPGAGGPGGYGGGGGGIIQASISSFYGTSGDGPGGGSPGGTTATGANGTYGSGGGGSFGSAGGAGGEVSVSGGQPGPTYGPATLLQLVGGSGGGGGSTYMNGPVTGAGGGGGGAIVIASSGTISAGPGSAGTILAAGGGGASGSYYYASGGGGAGGAVRLIATTLAGSFTLNAAGGNSGGAGGGGGAGYVRYETFNYNNFEPTVVGPIPTAGLPSSVTLPGPPTLQFVSVAGQAAPSNPAGSFAAGPDVSLPATESGGATVNPVTLVIQSTNIPAGTTAAVQMTLDQGGSTTVTSTPLAGAADPLSATAGVTLPDGHTELLYASATFAVTGMASARVPGLLLFGEHVKRVEVAAALGGPSDVIYVTTSGKRYSRSGLLGQTRTPVQR